MSTDPTPLAQRLVAVARNRIAICDWSDRAERTVAAVLRELADSYPAEAETNATPEEALELYALADSIEKGGEANG